MDLISHIMKPEADIMLEELHVIRSPVGWVISGCEGRSYGTPSLPAEQHSNAVAEQKDKESTTLVHPEELESVHQASEFEAHLDGEDAAMSLEDQLAMEIAVHMLARVDWKFKVAIPFREINPNMPYEFNPKLPENYC